MTLTGTGGHGGLAGGQGIVLSQSNLATDGGLLTLTGVGGASSSPNDRLDGVRISSDTIIASTDGDMALTGTGGSIGPGGIGVLIRDPGTQILSRDGRVAIIGTAGGNPNSRNNDGVSIYNGASVEASGAGDISILGTAAAGLADNQGVAIGSFTNEVTSTVRASDGNVTITGTGAATATDTGTFGSHGVFLFDASVIETLAAGSISLTGTGGGGAPGIRSANVSEGGTPIIVRTAGPGGGSMTFTADEIDLTGNVSVSGSQQIHMQPLDPELGITIGGTTTDLRLNLSSSDLTALQDGFSEIVIGHRDGTGAVTVAATELNDPLTVQAPGSTGRINVTGPLRSSGGRVHLRAGDYVVLYSSIASANETPLDVILHGDSDSTNGGPVQLRPGASIRTSGGEVIIGGGNDPRLDPAIGTAGVDLDNSGVIEIDEADEVDGVLIQDGVIDSASGNVSIRGIGYRGAPFDASGLDIRNESIISSAGGAITLIGEGGSNRSSGVNLIRASIVSTGAGPINVTGTGADMVDTRGVSLSSSTITAEEGPLTVAAINGSIRLQNSSAITTTGGDLTLSGSRSDNDAFSIHQGADSPVQAGALTRIVAGSGDVLLAAPANDFARIAVQSGHEVAINDANSLVFESASASGGLHVTAGTDLDVVGQLQLQGGLSATAAGDIVVDGLVEALGDGAAIALEAGDTVQVGAELGAASGAVDIIAGAHFINFGSGHIEASAGNVYIWRGAALL